MKGKFFLLLGIIAVGMSFVVQVSEMVLYIGAGLIGLFILINFFRIFFKRQNMKRRIGVERRLIEGY